MANWVENHDGEAGVIRQLNSYMAKREREAPDTFPHLRSDPVLIMASDYAGEHKESPFQVLTYLLADLPGGLERWDDERLRIRREYLTDGRRLSFKGLSDVLKQRAVIPFLKASARINGIILSVAVEKSLAESDFGYQFDAPSEIKPLVHAKLIRIALFGSVLVGGLSAEAQKLHWITDNDEIVSNERTQSAAGVVFGSLLKHACPHQLGGISIGIAGEFNDERRAEDLCAIPDLVGGTVAEILTVLNGRIPESTSLYTPITGHLSTKAELIAGWVATNGSGLKQLVCVVRPAGDRQVRFSFADPFIDLDRRTASRRLWRPPDKGWRQSQRGW
jgi:hypothetical protein